MKGDMNIFNQISFFISKIMKVKLLYIWKLTFNNRLTFRLCSIQHQQFVQEKFCSCIRIFWLIVVRYPHTIT